MRARPCAARTRLFELISQTGRCAPRPPSTAASLLLIRPPNIYKIYKLLTYEEYRAVSGVFQNIDPPTPLHPANMSLPRTKGGGVHHTRREVREWEVNILEEARHWIGLLQYNLSTIRSFELGPPTSRAFFFPLDHSSYSSYSSRTILRLLILLFLYLNLFVVLQTCILIM